MQLHFDPVADATVLSFKRGDKALLRQLEAEWKFMSAGGEDGRLTVVCTEEARHKQVQVNFESQSVGGASCQAFVS